MEWKKPHTNNPHNTYTMKLMTAKYKGTCAETGKPIRRGDVIYFDPQNRKVYCTDATAPQDRRPADASVAAYETAQLEYQFEAFAAMHCPSDRF